MWVVEVKGSYELDSHLVNSVHTPEHVIAVKARYLLRAEAPDEVQYMSAGFGWQLKHSSHWAVYMTKEVVERGAIITCTYVAHLCFVHVPASHDCANLRFAQNREHHVALGSQESHDQAVYLGNPQQQAWEVCVCLDVTGRSE